MDILGYFMNIIGSFSLAETFDTDYSRNRQKKEIVGRILLNLVQIFIA